MTNIDGLSFRDARRDDLRAIVALLVDDALGRSRDTLGEGLDPGYLRAFEAIEADPNQRLVVAERGGVVVGTFQSSYLPGLSRRGMWRAQIESVRVARECRGLGIGEAMMRWAIAQARARGCGLVQLTTDKSRNDAHRFYARLGFVASHEGMKLALD